MSRLYTVGYHSHEDHGEVTLLHERDLSHADLSALIHEVLPDAYRRADKAIADRWVIAPEMGLTADYRVTFCDVYDHVADLLCERHGFERAKFSAMYTAFGWSDLLKRDDWDGKTADLHDVLAAAGIAAKVPA